MEYTWKNYLENLEQPVAYYVTNLCPSTMDAHNLTFVCDHGTIYYSISLFPSNCGISIYHDIRLSCELSHLLWQEFTDFMRTTSKTSVIMVTHIVNSKVAQFMRCDPDVWNISKPHFNMNSSNEIIVGMANVHKEGWKPLVWGYIQKV